jgi:hypothetical protein
MSLHPSRILRTTAFAGAAVLAASLSAVSTATPANASGSLAYEGEEHNGECETEELCLYSEEDSGGSVFDMHNYHEDLSGETFPDEEESVDDNTRSYKSFEEEGGDENGYTWYWYVYEDKDYEGAFQCIAPGEEGNFDEANVSSAAVTNDPCEEEPEE